MVDVDGATAALTTDVGGETDNTVREGFMVNNPVTRVVWTGIDVWSLAGKGGYQAR